MKQPLSILITLCILAGCNQPTSLNVPPPIPPVPQGVSGYVFDLETSEPLRSATVTLDTHTPRTTTTDSTGYFVLEDVPAGHYSVRAMATEHAGDTEYVTVDTGLVVRTMLPLSTTSLTRGLVFQCMCDGALVDGSRYHGSVTSTDAILVPDRFHRTASALWLDGYSTVLEIPDAPSLNFGKNDFSICFWVKGLMWSGGTILGKSTGGSPFFGYLIGGNVDGYTSASLGTTYGEVSCRFFQGSDDDRWHFYVYQFDRHRSISLSVDGRPFSVGTTQLNSSQISQMAGNCDVPSPLIIGTDSYGDSPRGIIDDIRMYQGILNAAQIDSLYHENGW